MFLDFIFEASWEVCNKVGGIYTVLSTRAKTLQEKMRDHVVFVGPDCYNGTENPSLRKTTNFLRNGWQLQTVKA